MRKGETAFVRNVNRVARLFDAVRETLDGKIDTRWLDLLQQDAKNARPGWRELFEAWILGLEQAGGVSSELAEQWRRDAGACNVIPNPSASMWFCLIWTLLVTLTTLGSQSMLIGKWQVIGACGAVAAIGIIWGKRAGWLKDWTLWSPKRFGRSFRVASVSVAAMVIGVFLPAFVADLTKLSALQIFDSQQKKFETDTNGYPWIRDFALREFGIDVVMTSPRSAWARTTVAIADASPASMDINNSLCQLTISRESILNNFIAPTSQMMTKSISGVMMHELAHCLDVRRDNAGQGGAWTGKIAIAPADRYNVTDSRTYYMTANERQSTQLWREVLADMMTIGYWRLNTSDTERNALIAAMRTLRLDHAERDPAHATMCWIDLATNVPGPKSNRELFEWADALRTASNCVIPKG